MATPIETMRIRRPQAPTDLREYFAGPTEYFGGPQRVNPEPLTINIASLNMDFSSGLTLVGWYWPSRAHAAEIDALTRNFLRSVFHSTEGLVEAYTETIAVDPLDYESIIRPTTGTFRARLHWHGPAQPLPIDDD